MSDQTTGTVAAADQVVKLVDDVFNTIGDFKAKIWPLISTPRSVVCLVANVTNTPLTYAESHHDHGGFAATPEAEIDPQKGSSFGSQSKSGSLLTGTQGGVTYRGSDGVFFTVKWDNPYVGDNSSSTSTGGNNSRYISWSVTGSGNDKAEMRFVLLELLHSVQGAIREKWLQSGGYTSGLGFPQTDEISVAGGAYNDFEDGGSIYWSPNTGAHIVHGAIRGKYLAFGGPQSGLGFPTSDEKATADGKGFFNDFQNGGSIYWSPDTGAHYVHGAIKGKWYSIGGSTSGIGYPITDETALPDGVGFFNDFQDGGSIYWSPNTGPHILHGAIRLKYLSLGGPHGALGYPMSDDQDEGTGFIQNFEKGVISWTPGGGPVVTMN
jgi:uncharacterized protein with LGFP repeats